MLRDLLWLAGVVGGTGWLFYRTALRKGSCGGCPMGAACGKRC